MKIKIHMKDPDAVSEAVDEAVKKSVMGVKGITSDEREELAESRRTEIDAALEPWVKYSEYLTVEIDTEKKTAVVCPQ